MAEVLEKFDCFPVGTGVARESCDDTQLGVVSAEAREEHRRWRAQVVQEIGNEGACDRWHSRGELVEVPLVVEAGGQDVACRREDSDCLSTAFVLVRERVQVGLAQHVELFV